MSILRDHLNAHPEQAPALFAYFLTRTEPRHHWGGLTRKELRELITLLPHLTGDRKKEALAIAHRASQWRSERSCHHCGIFHGEFAVKFCKDCFAGELFEPGTDRRKILRSFKIRAREIKGLCPLTD